MRFCSSSVATSRSSSTSSLLSFNASTSSSAVLAPTTSHISTLDNNLLFSMFFTCILKLCLFISLPPLSIHNRSFLSIYPRTFLSLSNETSQHFVLFLLPFVLVCRQLKYPRFRGVAQNFWSGGLGHHRNSRRQLRHPQFCFCICNGSLDFI